MRKTCLFALLLAITPGLRAQSVRYVVKLKDKGGSSFTLSNPSAFLSQKAIARRNRQHISLDSTDLPVSSSYISALTGIPGVTILSTSKWFNEVFVEVPSSDVIDDIQALPFVLNYQAVSFRQRSPRTLSGIQNIKESSCATGSLAEHAAVDDSSAYGMNYPQIHIHQGEFLHKVGYRGEGMTIALLDAGFFGYTTNPALDSMRNAGQILGIHDFVANDNSVSEDDSHGANCLSILASNRPGFIVGTAPKANYLLYRTEDAPTETPSEEQNWIAGAEMADSAGADMISSSLGYINFDNPVYNHAYADRDGNTFEITIAADLAVKKGMIVTNSAGNSGNVTNDTKYIPCPADGDSVMTVGAVDKNGNLASFSSWGPMGNGKMKPNIASVGQAAVYADPSGNPATGNGTSYSNPNVAGLIACLWQAFPDFTNMDIFHAVEQSANKFHDPDNRLGYGIPNFPKAYQILEAKRATTAHNEGKDNWLGANPVPFKSHLNVFLKAPKTGSVDLKLIDLSGRTLDITRLQVTKNSNYYIPLNPSTLRRGIYVVVYWDGLNYKAIKVIKE